VNQQMTSYDFISPAKYKEGKSFQYSRHAETSKFTTTLDSSAKVEFIESFNLEINIDTCLLMLK
jgi:hypothetical protein